MYFLRAQRAELDLRREAITEQIDDFRRESNSTWLLARSTVHQIYEGAGHRTPIQRVLTVDQHEINPPAFAERRGAIVEALNGLPGVSCVLPGGAFYAFPNIRETGLTSEAFERSIHARWLREDTKVAGATCGSCHGNVHAVTKLAPYAPTAAAREKVPADRREISRRCDACHGDPAFGEACGNYLGLRAAVYVPETVPAAKARRLEASGAELLRVGSRYAQAAQAARERVLARQECCEDPGVPEADHE